MKHYLSPVAQELYKMSLEEKNKDRSDVFQRMIRKYETAYKKQLRKEILKPIK